MRSSLSLEPAGDPSGNPLGTRPGTRIKGSQDHCRDRRLRRSMSLLPEHALDMPDEPFGIDDKCGRECFDAADYRRIGGGIASSLSDLLRVRQIQPSAGGEHRGTLRK